MKDKLENIFGKGKVLTHESEDDITYIVLGHDNRTIKASIIVDKKGNDGAWHIEFNGTYRDFQESG